MAFRQNFNGSAFKKVKNKKAYKRTDNQQQQQQQPPPKGQRDENDKTENTLKGSANLNLKCIKHMN